MSWLSHWNMILKFNWNSSVWFLSILLIQKNVYITSYIYRDIHNIYLQTLYEKSVFRLFSIIVLGPKVHPLMERSSMKHFSLNAILTFKSIWKVFLMFENMLSFFSKDFYIKELSLCHKLWFSNSYISATQWRRP